jgi:hypothetical protein
MCPAIVTSYGGGSTCSIKLVAQTDPEVPEIPGVPIFEFGAGGMFLHMPIASGDGGLAIFSERDFTGWLVGGSVSKPLLLATHGLYAIFLPGLRHEKQPTDSNLESMSGAVLGAIGGPYVNVQSDKVTISSGPLAAATTKPLCKAAQFEAWAGAIETALGGLGVPTAALALQRQGAATTKLEAE